MTRPATCCCWRARGDELSTLTELVRTFDVDWLSGMSFALHPVTSVDAIQMILELEQVFGGPEVGPLAGVVRFVPIERLNAILVISSQPKLPRTRRGLDRAARPG